MLTQDFFSLFGLPERYALDRPTLDAYYRELQRNTHPDRYASASEQEKRIAMQQTAHINEGYDVLRNPLKRARYLLERRGVHMDDQQTTQADPDFLMQQMELRERLAKVRAQADPLASLDALARDIDRQYRAIEQELAGVLDGTAGDDAAALALVQKMQFFTRLQQEVQALEADLEDELL
ncbi:MAG TPA: Fe-S protein assembly co-chaperone HscB [Gammaproteobacteria bacterium]|nr:Fe-S protein assembly co-chaperone HscB [Gammaproteobacteria bacterium]